jgi:exodeoxyribonuclease VII large subunit
MVYCLRYHYYTIDIRVLNLININQTILRQKLIQKLKDWRAEKVKAEGVEPYLVLQNQTINNIAESMPSNKDNFVAIKGLGEKKFDKYGQEILAIVNDQPSKETPNSEIVGDNTIYSVSSFLNLVNSKLCEIDAKVKGEISSVDFRERYLFFTIKDAIDGSSLSCFMWSSNYELCGINIEIGMEVIIHGKPEIYKTAGRFSLRTDTVELVGEGALKKAYDELKKKLEKEGVFDESKKREIPALPDKIGLITSKEGAVIHDFGNNLGNFGFKTQFYNSRVEGALAVKQLSEAINYFEDKNIDILVVIRGGGSLESLQAFNNESLVRQIIDYPVPVLCGIGHDKDVPLFSLAADKQFSTPTAVAKELGKSWEELQNRLYNYQSSIVSSCSNAINRNKLIASDYLSDLKTHFSAINKKIANFDRIIGNIFNSYLASIADMKNNINQLGGNISISYSNILDSRRIILDNAIRLLKQNNPNRQLKLGYSIIFSEGKVIKSVSQVGQDQEIVNRVADGKIISKIKDIKNKEPNG